MLLTCSRMKLAPMFISSTPSRALLPLSGLPEAWDAMPEKLNLAETIALEEL